jgi:nitroreductase
MQPLCFDDKPANFPALQVTGTGLKPITQVLLDRRATAHFRPDPVPPEYLEAILRFALQAPSGYNIQPWRFVVVRDVENKKRLQQAAFDQAKVGEAPVVVVAFAVINEWRAAMEQIFREGARRGMGSDGGVAKMNQNALQFLATIPISVWMNRHTMIAFTTMMLVAEAYGLDTAPMEGFDPSAVRRVLALPENAEVIAMLAIGFAQEPDKKYSGRLALSEAVYAERYGEHWKTPGEKTDH